MSLDYNFRIATPLTAGQVVSVARDALALTQPPHATANQDKDEFQGPGFLLAAGPIAHASQAMMEEGLGIVPSVDLQFWVDADQRHHAVTALLRGVLAVLQRVPGDAVLLFGGESVLLLRRGRHLQLDSRTGIWTPERLALADMPYALQDLPVL